MSASDREFMRWRNRHSHPVSRTALVEWENDRLTPDEKFARGCSIEWARRIMRVHSPFNPALLEWAAWALGPEDAALAREFSRIISPVIQEEFDDLVDWNSISSRNLFELFQRLDRGQLADLYAALDQALAERAVGLALESPSPLQCQLERFATLFRLDPAECGLVTYLLISDTHSPIDAFFDRELECRQLPGRPHLAALLGVPEASIPNILSGRLSRIGIIDEMHGVSLESDFLKLLLSPPEQALETRFFQTRDVPALPLEAHVVPRESTDHLVELLRQTPRRGATHIILYGPPGTGKTCFARSLAAAAGCRLVEVTRTEENTGRQRRFALEASRSLATSLGDMVVLVDEADHLLRTDCGPFGFLRWGESRDKGWLNEYMEEPGLRAIWVVNSLSGIEDSVKRRFCFSLEFRPFNKAQRERAWRSALEVEGATGKLSARDIRELASSYPVNAGVLTLAIRKALDLGRAAGKPFREAVIVALEAHAQLDQQVTRITQNQVDKAYDPSVVNVKGDLALLTRRMKHFSEALENDRERRLPSMNILLYGPPGTGKSEWARHLARQLKREVVECRGSDIISSWVGQTEQNLAAVFSRAEALGAILVFDEVDTFLFSRAGAQRSWEVSAVNEFLTQMERFRGILICTTNRLPALDEASLRRFSEKVAFDWMTLEGKVKLFKRMLSPLLSKAEAEGASGRVESRLDRVPFLAPGDFRVVRDQFGFLPRGTATMGKLLEALEGESACKVVYEGRKPIGF